MRRFAMVQGWAAALLLAACAQPAAKAAEVSGGPVETAAPNGKGQSPAFPGQTRAPMATAKVVYRVTTFASGLDHPWGLAFLPDGRMLVTERPGRLRLIDKDGTLSAPIPGGPQVAAGGQGGLFDVALDPAFDENRFVYLTYFEQRPDGYGLSVARAKLATAGGPPVLQDLQVIFRTAPAYSDNKNIGGRMAFGRDGTLFVSVGDRFATRDQAQDLASDFGKIIRIKPDGSIPKDNPFLGTPGARPEIWSLGHRNPEALAVNPADGTLWDVEHGARGGDEINVAEAGKNYGWPTITYGIDYSGAPIGVGTAKAGLEQPLYYWDPVIAPSGMAFYTGEAFPAWKGSLFVGSLKGTHLDRLTLDGRKVIGEERLLTDQNERIRDVRQGPDGALYVLTDSSKGRVLKVVP